jgi:uridylate kinase
LVTKYKYKRVLLKFTGELFGFENGKGINFSSYDTISKILVNLVRKTKVELVVVIGGGNIFRGREKDSRVDEATADYMGMMATVINGLGLQEAIERNGGTTRMMTAFEVKAVAESFIRRRAIRHLGKGHIVILSAGIGSPFFTTDTGAALRAAELKCDVLLKASNVDGVYSSDPKKDLKATKFEKLTFDETISKNLKIMDTSAFQICKEKNIPVTVFNINKLDSLEDILKGKTIGTLISN